MQYFGVTAAWCSNFLGFKRNLLPKRSPVRRFPWWKREGRRKQPYCIKLRDASPFAFAGLWDHWRPTDGNPVETCTILTTAPNAVLEPIHDRMPVILPRDAYTTWLDPAVRHVERVQALLTPSLLTA